MADELSNALIDSVTADNIKDVMADLMQTTVELVADNEALKAIPFFGVALKVWKGLNSYKDFLFMKIIHRFLFAYSTVSEDKRTELLIKMEDDPAYKEKVGEKLIFILNKVDDVEKAEILGNLFKSYVENKLEFTVFCRLALIIEKLFMYDLNSYGKYHNNKQRVFEAWLCEAKDGDKYREYFNQHKPMKNFNSFDLANSGFLSGEIKETGLLKSKNKPLDEQFPQTYIDYKLNAYGALILKFGMLLQVPSLENRHNKIPKY